MDWIIWVGFLVLVGVMITIDLGLFHRKTHVIKTREALLWTAFWITLAMLFNGVIYGLYEYHWLGWQGEGEEMISGREACLQYVTGFLVEKSLSVDNIFVIAMIFSYFRVPAQNQHRVLFWGILSAMVLRGIMIGAGAALIHRFEWTIYIFGVLLILAAMKMLFSGDDEIDPNKNIAYRLARRFFNVTHEYHGSRFFVRIDGKLLATPLMLTLVLVETTDVMFAVDSIPAIFAVTRDPFLIFTSNIFAIFGLRSLYFALAGLMDTFHYLKYALVVLLVFIGVKMLLTHVYKIPNSVSLGVIVGLLTLGVLGSLLIPRKVEVDPIEPVEGEIPELKDD